MASTTILISGVPELESHILGRYFDSLGLFPVRERIISQVCQKSQYRNTLHQADESQRGLIELAFKKIDHTSIIFIDQGRSKRFELGTNARAVLPATVIAMLLLLQSDTSSVINA